MSGYTPVFSSIYSGTLYGKWPAAAVWASVLPLADKNGVINYSWQALSGMTGWPMELLRRGMDDLMLPDPGSNSQEEAGKRLVPHEQHGGKDWGWRAVNHGKYKERARKQAWDAERTASGRDAARKRAERGVPSCPDVSRESPLSDTDTDTKKKGADAPVVQGLDRKAWETWIAYRSQIRKPLKPASIPAAQKALAAFGSDQLAVVDHSIANGYTGLFAPNSSNKPKGGHSGGLAFTPIN